MSSVPGGGRAGRLHRCLFRLLGALLEIYPWWAVELRRDLMPDLPLMMMMVTSPYTWLTAADAFRPPYGSCRGGGALGATKLAV